MTFTKLFEYKFTSYEVWVKPDNGPLTVRERDEKNREGWLDEEEAVSLAKRRKIAYPHMDFVVIKHADKTFSSQSGVRSVIFDTSKPI